MNRNQFQLVIALALSSATQAFSSQSNQQEFKRSLENVSTASPQKAKQSSIEAEEQINDESPKTKKRARTLSRENFVSSSDKLNPSPTKQARTYPELTKEQQIDQFLIQIKADQIWSKSDVRSISKLLKKSAETRLGFITETLTALTEHLVRDSLHTQSASAYKSIIRKINRLQENLLEDVKNVTTEYFLAVNCGSANRFADTLDVLMETPEDHFSTAVQVMTIIAPSAGFSAEVPYETIIRLLRNLQNYRTETILNNYLLFISGSSWEMDQEDLIDLLKAIIKIENLDRLNNICLLTSDLNHDGFSDAVRHTQILEALTKLNHNKIEVIKDHVESIKQTRNPRSVIEALHFIPDEQATIFLSQATKPVIPLPRPIQVIAPHQPMDLVQDELERYFADDHREEEEIEGDYNVDNYDQPGEEDEPDAYPYEHIAIAIHYEDIFGFQALQPTNQLLLQYASDIQYDEEDRFAELISHWRSILESEDRDAASDLIDLITSNFRRLGLTATHPLVELAQTVDTLIHTNDRSSPYYIYAQMRMKKERSIIWDTLPLQTCVSEGQLLAFKPESLRSFCSSLKPDFSQIPVVTVNGFTKMLRALVKKLLNQEFADSFADKQDLYNVISRNLSPESHLQSLLSLPEDNRISAKLKCILKNYSNIIVTDIRLSLFANFLLSVQNCTVGQDTAIEEIYYNLPAKARLKAQVDDVWRKDKSHKALQILGQAIQRVSMEQFSEGTAFVSQCCGLPPKSTPGQAAHQVQALRGLIGDYVGLPSELKFDMNAPLIYEPILRATCEDLLTLYYQNNQLETMLPALKRTINQEIVSLLPRDKEIYAHFMNIFGDQTEDHILMVYKDDEDLFGKFQGLNDKGVIGMLKHVNILEEVE